MSNTELWKISWPRNPFVGQAYNMILIALAIGRLQAADHKSTITTSLLSPNKSKNYQDSDSDWFIYCIDIRLLTLLLSLQYFSESSFGNESNDNKFVLPNPWVALFFIYPTLFSSVPHPAINNDRSLTGLKEVIGLVITLDQ